MTTIQQALLMGSASAPLPYIFLDTFTGAAGPLSGHTADTGQSWVNTNGSTTGITDLQLDGSGVLRATNVFFKSAGVSLNLSGNSFVIEASVSVISTGVDLLVDFWIANNINTPGASTYTQFSIGYLRATGTWRCRITDNSGTTGFINVDNAGLGTRLFTFVMNNTGKFVYLGSQTGTLITSRVVVTTVTNAGVILETSPNAGNIGVSLLSVN